MALLKKDVPAPVLPEARVVSVPELGGDVVVHPLLLSDRLAIARAARNGADFAHIIMLLSLAVRDGEGEPLFAQAQWEVWGAAHIDTTLDLWVVAQELSGLTEKKSTAQNSGSQ